MEEGQYIIAKKNDEIKDEFKTVSLAYSSV